MGITNRSDLIESINSNFRQKSPIFPMPLLKGFPWNWVSAQGSEETRMVGLPDGRKRFKIGLAVLIQYWRVTDTQPATLP